MKNKYTHSQLRLIFVMAVLSVFSGFGSVMYGALSENIIYRGLNGNSLFDETESGQTYPKALLTVETYTDDGIRFVKARLIEKTENGELVPVEWEELLFEVERKFGLLPFAEFMFTDDNGEAEAEFPAELPGDAEGNIVIVVRLSEHPDYGDVEVRKTVAWGIPLMASAGFDESRSWMSKDPPLFFAFIFWGGLAAVWGTIGLVTFNVFKIYQSSFNT